MPIYCRLNADGKGYSFQWIDPVTQKYIAGTNFSDVLKLYHFDCELSHLVFSYLSQIEVALRAHLVNAFQITQDTLILNDPSVFVDKRVYWKNQSTIASEICRSNDIFIEHNFNSHDGAVPLWAVVEVLSFGSLSKIIKNLKTGNESVFSILVQNYQFKGSHGISVNPSKKIFTSWIQAVSIMRRKSFLEPNHNYVRTVYNISDRTNQASHRCSNRLDFQTGPCPNKKKGITPYTHEVMPLAKFLY